METAAIHPESTRACVHQPIADHGMTSGAGQTQDVAPAIAWNSRNAMPFLYARRDIAPGEIIARISKCMLVTSEAASRSAAVGCLLAQDEPFSQDVCLAVYLLDAGRGACNWQHQTAGTWNGPAPHPLFLSMDQLEMLRGSYAALALQACRSEFTAEHARLSAVLTGGGAGTLDDYLRARSAVMTHAQAIDTARGQVLAMLPLPAMFSHAADACVRWEDMAQDFVLRAQRAIGKNTRLPLSNSGWDRSEAFAPLGALLDGDSNRRTDLALPGSAAGWPDDDAAVCFGRMSGGKRLFRISDDHDDASARQLLAYLRASSCLIVDSMDGRVRFDAALKEYLAKGRINPICRDSELLALQTLRAACQYQLEGFGTSILDDEQLLEQHASGSIERSIVALRLKEKRILFSYIGIVDTALPLLLKYDKNSSTRFPEYLRNAARKSAAGQTIFVSIASYRDPLLWNTVKECLTNAERPDLLRFGIVDQGDEDAGDDLARLPFAHQIRYVHIRPRDSRGACWARSIAFGLYDNEDFLLQIDSHMIFDHGWDRILKMQFQELSLNNSKSVLSAYPWAFEIEDGEAVRKVSSPGTLVLRPMPEATISEDSPVLRFHPFPQPVCAHYHAFSLAGGFLFTIGSFVDEIPYDPHLYFHGEEQNLTIRAYTHGWDMYHPRVIPLYHHYKKPERNENDAPRHWDETDDLSRKTAWWTLEQASKRRMCQLLYTNTIKGAYGLGSVRSLEDFAAYSGIDYRRRIVTPRDQVLVPKRPV